MDPQDTHDLSKNVARRLIVTREALGLNQTEFCETASLSQPRYSPFESGKRRLSLDAALALVETYNLTLDWFYRGDPSGLPSHLATNIRALRRGK
jgi:transcriptional regulator with XRE-family HTH domain